MAVCAFCQGELAEGAVKCQHCGEWVEGREPSGAGGGFNVVAVAVITIAVMFVVLSLATGLLELPD